MVQMSKIIITRVMMILNKHLVKRDNAKENAEIILTRTNRMMMLRMTNKRLNQEMRLLSSKNLDKTKLSLLELMRNRIKLKQMIKSVNVKVQRLHVLKIRSKRIKKQLEGQVLVTDLQEIEAHHAPRSQIQ